MPTSPDTSALVATLVDDLTPVRPLRSPWVRFARSLIVAGLFAATGVALLGTRFDAWTFAERTSLTTHFGFELMTSALAAMAAFVLSVPAAPRAAAVRWLPIGLGTAWILILITELAWAQGSTRPLGPQAAGLCFNSVVAVAAIPTIFFVGMILRAAPLHPAWSGGLAMAAGGGLGASAVHLHCLNVEPLHALVSHVGPVLGVAVVGAVGGAFWHRAASARLRRKLRR